MNNEYSLTDFFVQLSKWKKQIIFAVLIVLIVSLIGSVLMPDYYKSETIFYAASQDMSDPVPYGYNEKSIRIYGDDKDLDRLFSIASSYELLFFLIDSFDLYKKYEIDRDDNKAKYKVKTKFEEHYKTIKTKHGAILLSVEDKDAKLAAAIADAAREKISDIAQKIIKESQSKVFQKFEAGIRLKEVLIDSLTKSLSKMRRDSRVYDTRTQGEIYTQILADAAADYEESKAKLEYFKNNTPSLRDSIIRYQSKEKGFSRRLAQITQEMNQYEAGISEVRKTEIELYRLHDQISVDKERLNQLEASIQKPFTALHVIEYPEVSVQHHRPKRMILVFISVMIGFVLACLAVFVIENIKTVHPEIDRR
ncbi:MAG: hypothetical protein IPM42_11935 [Saprospiraceae bacterium]|nr:hypothetical protein [Saprospiraceae bacterium]